MTSLARRKCCLKFCTRLFCLALTQCAHGKFSSSNQWTFIWGCDTEENIDGINGTGWLWNFGRIFLQQFWVYKSNIAAPAVIFLTVIYCLYISFKMIYYSCSERMIWSIFQLTSNYCTVSSWLICSVSKHGLDFPDRNLTETKRYIQSTLDISNSVLKAPSYIKSIHWSLN